MCDHKFNMATSINITNKPWCDEPAIVPVQEQLVKAAVLQDTHAAAPENTRLFSVEIQRNIISSDKLTSSGDQVDGNDTSSGKDFPFKVVTHLTSKGSATDEDSGDRECHYASSAEEALQIYEDLYKQHASTGDGGMSMEPVSSVNDSRWIGSVALRKTLLYRETYSPTEDLSPEVAKLVDDVWKEAMGKLKEHLAVPVASILPGQVAKAEAVLYRMWNILHDRKDKQKHEQKHKQKQKVDEESDVESSTAELKTLEKEFYGLIPHHDYMERSLVLLSRVATKLDLCQMIRDVVYISEETGWQKRPTPKAKYRALRCYIQHLPSNHPEYEKIRRLVLSTMPGGMKLNTLRIFAVSRPPEEEGYRHDIGNDTLLFHATKPNNVLGILSRGLLMPKVVVEMFNGQRRDEGLLGPGLYFGDRISTCIQYTKNGFFSKTRMMLVLKVAMGATQDYYEFNTKLKQAPDGFNSTHGVRASEGRPSEFKEDEFVVYSPKQQCIRYLVEFSFDDDDDVVYGYDYDEDDVKDDEVEEEKETLDKIDLADVQCCQDPVSRTATGLVVDNSREGVLLEQVHVRGHITDLAAKITVLQVYQNTVGGTDVPEARYVFPLDEKAAVCGFEAFINDRHVVGTVKTKEKAKEEYQEAIREGHGAYLMQEEAANVFSVSIGNLPPNAKVVIKITYVTELVEEDGGKMAFYLLGSVAPWLQEEIHGTKLTEEAQALVGVASNETDRKESLQLTVEMPSDISTVQSPTHAIKVKREKTKATVTLGDGVGLGDGFQLLIGILNANKPRIWTEFDPSNNSYASMAVFYPTIQSDSIPDPEVVLLMDCSTSMNGEPKQDAKKICKMFLQSLPKKSRFNVITFGTDFIELFPTVEPTGQQQLHQAFEFIESARSVGGSSEGWRPLRSLSLLSMMKSVRNVLLVSDGHLTNEKLTLEIASNYKSVNRIFTCGVGSAGNRHILRALADVSGGAFESFNPKAKSKWEGKISAQIDRCRQPSVSCVNAIWQTKENEDGGMKPKDLIQVPAQTSSVFTGSKVLLYSLGPKVQEVQLNVEIAGKSVGESLKSPIEFEGSSLTLHRLAGRALVRDYEFGSFHQDHALHETRMYDLTKYLTDLSIRLSIITPLTSFIAIEKRDRKTKLETASPDVDKLLSIITRDDLESLHWTEVILEQEGSAESNVTKILRQAKIAQSNFSYASAEKYYNSALNMAKENVTSMQSLLKTCCLELSKFTMRVKGDTEKALQWIQPVVTHVVTEQELEEEEREEEDLAMDTAAREYSRLLQNKVHQGPAEKIVISRATGYAQRGPTEIRPISLARRESFKAVKYKSRRTFPFFSFLKPKKKKKNKMEPISFAMPSALADKGQFRGGVVGMSSKPEEEIALDQRESKPVYYTNSDTTLDQATLDELRRQANRLEEQLEKDDSLLASAKVFKKKKSLGSSLFGWGKGESKKEKKLMRRSRPVRTGLTLPTVGFSFNKRLFGSGRRKYEEPEDAASYLSFARMMKFERSNMAYDSTAESRRSSPLVMDSIETRLSEASEDSLYEKEGEDEATCALTAEYSPPSSPALARARPIEVLAQGSLEISDDEFQPSYSLASVSSKFPSLSSTMSPPEVYRKYGSARPEPPPFPPLILGAEAPLPSPSGPPPPPPPLPPTSGLVLTGRMGEVHPPPDAGPPMPGVSPPPPPPPPPPAGLPTRRMPVVPPPPTAPPFQPPRPKPSPRLESTDLKSKDKSVADQDMMFDLMPLGSTLSMASDSTSDDEGDIIWVEAEPNQPMKTLKSLIMIKESKRTLSDFNHVISLQNKDGMWSWEDHGHLIDDLFVIDFQDIYAFCCQLPVLPYVHQNLHSILLSLLLLIYLEDVLPEVLPNLEDISPSNQDANGKVVDYMECMGRAEEWFKRQEEAQLLPLKMMLFNHLDR